MTSLAIMARSRSRDQKPKQLHDQQRVIVVSARPGNPQQGLLRFGNLVMRCALGKSGIGILKHEGDGKTPLAQMKILFGFYRKDRWSKMCRQPWLLPVSHCLGWCDAPQNRNYNRAIKHPYPDSYETLMRDDSLYDCVIVLDWNMTTRARNYGSAIFCHIAREGYQPTEGCVAVSRRDMTRLVRAVNLGTQMKTVG